jgi:hypothetical protein
MSQNTLAQKVDEVGKNLSDVLEGHESFKAVIKQSTNPEEATKIALGLAFTLNSLFYSMVRV